MRWVAIGAALGALAAGSASADPVAARWSSWSPDGRWVAEMDPARMETAVYFVDRAGARHYEWSMPGWSSRVSLANGGDHLVVASEDGGIVRSNWRPDDVLLRFYERGHLVREVTLAELVPDPGEMLPLRSHYYWGRTRGFDADGRFVVETVDRTVRFLPSGALAAAP